MGQTGSPRGRAQHLCEQGLRRLIPFSGAELTSNVAEIRVGNDGVSIQLEVFVGDISAFEAVLPDDWFRDGASARSKRHTRLAEFAEIGMSVRFGDRLP